METDLWKDIPGFRRRRCPSVLQSFLNACYIFLIEDEFLSWEAVLSFRS